MQNSNLDKKSSSIFSKISFLLIIAICSTSLINSAIALILGFLFSNFIGHPFIHINRKAISWLLKIAVIGLGFGMNIQETFRASNDAFLLTIISIVVVIAGGFVLGKALKIRKETTHLISSGTAICGGSAIATVAPVIGATEKDISISLGAVFLLNSIALIIFPYIGHLLGLTQYEFGIWCAIAIHDTSSVVGAALTYGDQALQVATTVKMARVLWIIPLSILSMFMFKGKNNNIKIPWFILLFVFAIILNSYSMINNSVAVVITDLAKRILVVTLFLVGAGLTFEMIRTAGWKSMLLGICLWMIISVFSLLYITF